MATMRLLPLESADGPANMAADEALLHAAQSGVASLRFYTWSPATLSLGYFQAASARLRDPRLAALPFVRRPTGGQDLVHDREVTYALAVPDAGRQPWLLRMHQIIVEAFRGLDVHLILAGQESRDASTNLCFRQVTPGDVLCRGAKVVGSAQRRHRQCLLQHGGILLAGSPHTPALPGMRELAGRVITPEEARQAIVQSFATTTGCTIVEQTWTDADIALRESLIRDKYGTGVWNQRR